MTELVPYPHFNKGEKGAGWRIEEAGGLSGYVETGKGKRLMRVPLDDECLLCKDPNDPSQRRHDRLHAQGVRNHEQAHVRFTTNHEGALPRLPKKLRDEYFQAVEDLRLDYALADAVGIDQPPILCPAHGPQFIGRLGQMDDKMRVLMMLASGKEGSADRDQMRRWLTKAMENDDPKDEHIEMHVIENIVTQTEQMLSVPGHAVRRQGTGKGNKATHVRSKQTGGVYPTLRHSIRTARWLQDLLDDMAIDPEGQNQQQEQKGQGGKGESEQEQEQAESGQEEGEADDGSFDPMAGEQPEAEADDAPAEPSDAEQNQGEGTGDPAQSDPNPNIEDNLSGWGTHEIQHANLCRPLPGRLRTGWSTTDTGTMVGDLGRWMVDQRIFKTMRAFPGGTVLLDDSGSMSLTQEEIYEVMLAVPGVKFAVYAGNGQHGIIRIVADKGKVAAADECQLSNMGTNTIDGPALAWLGKQKDRPLIWLSDGWVNGARGADSSLLTWERDLLLRKFNIRWLNPHLIGGIEESPRWLIKMLLGKDVRKGGEKKAGV